MQLAPKFVALQAFLASAVSAAAVFPRQTNSSSPTSSSPSDPFPTNVGYAGTIKNGAPPFLAVTDRIPGQLKDSSIETRWKPIDACDDDDYYNIFEHLGNTSPYFSSPLFADFQKQNAVLPEKCTVKQVHMLHRHGARYPTSYATEGAPYFGQVIANVSKLNNPNSNFSAWGPLAFLNDWKYELGAEILNPVGNQQLFDSGVMHYYRYGKLYNASDEAHKPVIRTTSEQRMLDSARYFTLGFFGWEAADKINMEVIIEGGDGLGSPVSFNNTLAPYSCTNANNITLGDSYLRPIWDGIYLPNITQRLQQYVSGLTLKDEDVYGMQSLCSYETAALGYSNFCGLFTKEEWDGFEYDLDLEFSGDYGIMSPSGKAQGIGWVQEFLDRLTNTTFDEATITTENSTFDSNPTYLPLDQKFYFDFSHDSYLLAVLVALNYTQVVGEYLDPYSPNPDRTFVLSHIVPFAARLVWEIVECEDDPKQYIRTLINEAVILYSEAQGCPDGKALCPLEDFVKFQQTNAYKDANFDKACFGVNGTDFVITGPVNNGTVY